ncbi:MAG: hypothetical protein EOO04_04365 [Chitinophagaceae bacterium]|nr:MAG: hypothetical protein EOO04_04365 [Chitinophagaceae bacterium]
MFINRQNDHVWMMERNKNSVSKKLYLRVGIGVAAFFPGVFVFDKVGANLGGAMLLFGSIFCWIITLWIFNAVFIDFSRLSQQEQRRKAFVGVTFSLFISTPLFCLFGILFQQQSLIFSSLVQSNFSLKAWLYFILRLGLFDVALLVVKYVLDQGREKQRIARNYEQLKIEQLKATHESLKQQVDPHFLFNALNTMQSLVKQDDKQNTLQFIQELGRVYRYMLTRRDKSYVSMRDEIEFLKSYLYLLQIRFGDAFRTEIRISENCLNSHIPVHTLQLLAENAVKHNAVIVENPLLLLITNDANNLVVTNNIVIKPGNVAGSGIGLQNIAQRYRLLFNKEIHISADANTFTVSLPIINDYEHTYY